MRRGHYDTPYAESSNGSRPYLVRQSKNLPLHLGGMENVVDKNFSRSCFRSYLETIGGSDKTTYWDHETIILGENWTFSRYVTIRRLIRASLMGWWITLKKMVPKQGCWAWSQSSWVWRRCSCIWNLPSFTGSCWAVDESRFELKQILLSWSSIENRFYWVDLDWNRTYWVDFGSKQILLSWLELKWIPSN
jgi:hypothetical protein